MGYKQGVACGSSVTLLIGSAGLLALYIACSSVSCQALSYSYLSPLWTGVLLLTTAFVGIFMSTTKSEKGCGGFYLFLSILGILATIGCVCLTLYAFFWEIGLFTISSVNYRPSYTNFDTTTVAPTTTPATATHTEPGVLFGLWLAMMCVAFVLSIVTCVTSCQYCCCCQEQTPTERIVFVTQDQSISPQNIVLENTSTIVNHQQPPQQMVLIHHQGSSPRYVQQPFPTELQAFPGQPPVVFQQPPPPYAAAVQPAPFIGPPQPAPTTLPPQQQFAPPQQQLAPPQQHWQPTVHPSAPPAPAVETQSHPQCPSGPQGGPSQPEDRQADQTSRINNTSAPSASVYQPLIQETRQETSPDSPRHTYEENLQNTADDDYEHTYNYPDAGSAANSTVHRSNYDPQSTPSGLTQINRTNYDPQPIPSAPTQSNSELYSTIGHLSDEEYEDTEVDPNPTPQAPVGSSDYVNKDIVKTSLKKRKR